MRSTAAYTLGIAVPSWAGGSELLETPFVAALLSFLYPGLGQAAGRNRGRSGVVALPVLAVRGVFALILIFDRRSLFGLTPDQGLLTSLLILDLMLFVYHLWAVLDAYVLARKARPDWLPRGASSKWATA